MSDEPGDFFCLAIDGVRNDIRTGGEAGNGIGTIKNLFNRFNFKIFGITFTVYGTSLFEAVFNTGCRSDQL